MVKTLDNKKNLDEEEFVLENEEDLNILQYSGEEDRPLFESIRVTKKDFSIFELYRKYKKEQLILDIDCQRNSVWTAKQKCELIESILMGLAEFIEDVIEADGKYRKEKEYSNYISN